MAATTPSCAERSSRRASTRSRTSDGSTAAMAAIWTDRSSAQSASILLDAGTTGEQALPGAGHVTAERGGGAESGDDDGVGLMWTFRWSGCCRCGACGGGREWR